ncbi:MAG: cytochrome c oxidase subunit II [Actinobacteria bacterium]|nr:cytochrome c oxidase subunit II [Actinomycetota bacterium]
MALDEVGSAAAEGGVLDPHGPVARVAEDLWWLMFWLGLAVFVLFAVLLALGLWRRRGDDVPRDDEEARLTRWWLVGGGVVLPIVGISVVFAATLAGMRDTPTEASAAADGALEIELVGHQFWYEVRYPEAGVVTANELHMPVGRPVVFRLTSRDVIHSFWVPALGGKMDLIPERENVLVLQADVPGRHVARCGEFCGLSHAHMELVVVAESDADFETWLSGIGETGAPTGDEAARGEEVFASADCIRCHGPAYGVPDDGQELAGPDLTAMARRASLGAGVLENTWDNAAAFIRDPAEFKPGVDMPANDLSDEDLAALLVYLGYDR